MLNTYDVVIVGSGLSGLTVALKCANAGLTVAIVTKESVIESSSYYAQGGIAAVWDIDDSFESHINDTLNAGAGLCDSSVVEFVVSKGPESINWLIENGVIFSRRGQDSSQPDEFHLTQEGGHSARRIIHAEDATGQRVESTLESRIRSHRKIDIFEQYIGIELITKSRLSDAGEDRCLGLYALNIATEEVVTFASNAVVLATGGASKTYLYTSNPDTSTGDGIAMAWRAGCRISNMEFVQFHPTCLYHPHAKSFLISEAVRGEGGKLILPDSSEFMHKYDKRGELAPRDIVARAIDHEMKLGGHDCVLLDITMKPEKFLRSHFPNIYEKCLHFGIDISKDPVPVVPAAHYSCGGVIVNQSGQTDLAGLYCVGESACTGLHGANRLASNSLLECIVFADSAFEDIRINATGREIPQLQIPQWDESRVTDPDELVVVSHNWDELRRFMWDYVGIVRTQKRLERALRRVDLLSDEVRDFYSQFRVNRDLIELRNLVLVSELTVRCALARHESRGLHFVLDYPGLDPAGAKNTVLTPN
ncbi:MAG: L-aspartate oxidase [Acidiferrobacterales bacterium]|nr:L-aspartate oxidase [Acidiferrobacterales bacterium]